MDTPVIKKKLPIEEWAKLLDKSETVNLLEWAVGNPGVIAQPYTKNISEGEFIQLLMHIVTMFAGKITFTETPLHGWDDIAEFLGVSLKRSKAIAKEFDMPVAILNTFPFTTKERLSVWMNNTITRYPYFLAKKSPGSRRIKTDLWDARIDEVQNMKKYLINHFHEEYPPDLLHFIDKYIDKMKIRKIKKTDMGEE